MRTNFGKVIALGLFTTAFATPLFAAEPTNITLIHTNDTHSNVEDNGSTIGFAKMATYAAQVRAEGNTLVLDAGDMFQGMPFANMEKGHSIIALANQVGYDVMVPGNHEYDFGAENFDAIVEKLNFPVIAANILKNGEAAFEAYMIKDFDDVKVGIFGIATPETAYKTHPNNVIGYDFTDITVAAQETVTILKEVEEVDVVIMLAHLGLDEGDHTSDNVANAVEGIDVIIDGHSHTLLEEGRMVNDTLIVSTGEKLQNIGRVELVVEDGKVVSKTASLVTYADLSEVTPDEVVTQIIAETNVAQEVILQEVVGQTAVALVGERENVRTGETNLGQLATNAIIDLTGADVVMINGGGIRATIEAGDITRKDLITVFPYGNTVMVKAIKGSDIVAALEHGVSGYPDQKGAFPHTAGITFTLNAYKEAGERISDVKVAGVAIDMDATYTLATNDFMAVGGDDYTMFSDYPVAAEYNTLMDTLMDYIEAVGVVAGEFETRMTVVTEAPVVDVVVPVAPTEAPVPLRAYAEALGFEVGYTHATKEVTLQAQGIVIVLTIGDNVYEIQTGNTAIKGAFRNAIELIDGVSYFYLSDLESIIELFGDAA